MEDNQKEINQINTQRQTILDNPNSKQKRKRNHNLTLLKEQQQPSRKLEKKLLPLIDHQRATNSLRL